MSARREKLKRRAALAELGISKAALRAQQEFERDLARVRLASQRRLDEPIVSRQPRRRTLALVGLVIVGVLILAIALAGC